MPNIEFGKSTIEYNIEYKPNKKDVIISVERNHSVNVVAPEDINHEELETILRKKAPWILKKQFEFSEIQDTSSAMEFLSGEKIQYLGRRYKLKVIRHSKIKSTKLSFSKGRFIAEIPLQLDQEQRIDELLNLTIDWYKVHGTEKLQERIKHYSNKMEVSPSQLTVKDQQMRWGSCTKNGTLLINWRIMMAPMRIVDYVLVHEMAHLRFPDHSDDYWRFVRSILPDYEERKEWLRINGPTLHI